MFAYCRNEPVIRADDTGTEDYVILGDELFSEEFLRSRDGGGGGQFARISCSTPGGSPRLVSISTAQGKFAAQGGGTATGSTTSCSIIGGGHGNPTHSANINTFMSDLANSGNYTTIYGNRALSTVGLNGSYRPDVIAIGGNGVIEVWEFASPSQRYGTVGYTQLAGKIAIMSEMNPGVIFHNIIPW